MAAQIITDTQAIVDSGLATASAQLAAAIKVTPLDIALVNKVQALRDRYVFEKMQLVRLEILKVDNSQPVQQAVQSLTTANNALSTIQKAAAATTQWASQAATALTTVASAVTNLESVVG